MRSPNVAVFLDPVSFHLENDRLFDASGNTFSGDGILAPYAYAHEWFAQRGIPLHTGDRLETGAVTGRLNVYMSLGLRTRWPRLAARRDVVLAAFFALECPIVEPRLYRHLAQAAAAFHRVYSFSDEASLKPFLTSGLTLHHFRLPQSYDAVHDAQWRRTDRKFITMINANKLPRLDVEELYGERLRAIEFFGRTGDFDLFGVGWDVPPYRTGETYVPATARSMIRSVQGAWFRVRPDPLLVAARRAWRGPVVDKAATLGGYTFAICFENMKLRGWITEKIFDCLYAGTIPVYLGDPDIADVIPAECFVDMRRFSSYPELKQYLHSLGPGDLRLMREVGRDFLGSEQFRSFSKRTFAETLGEIVATSAGVGSS
jgi:hypothetical protein